MGTWDKSLLPFSQMYKQIVKEGFILTQGSLNLSFSDNPFRNVRPNFPSFQLLKVHKNHPVEVLDSGKITVRPYKDKRLIGQILLDKNPNIYEAVSFFLAPYEISLPESYPGKIFAKIDGFETLDNKRNLASLVYIDDRELNIDTLYTSILSILIPSQIPAHLQYWLYHSGRVQAYDEKAKFGEGWKIIGRFDLNNTAEVADSVSKELEKRFKTDILTRRN